MQGIFDYFVSLIQGTQEYRGWGWNLFTLGFIIVLGEAVVVVFWSGPKQLQTIWHAKSITGMSIPTKLAACLFYAAALSYGIELKSLGLMLAAPPILLLQLLMVVALRKVGRGFAGRETLVAVVCAGVAILSFTPGLAVPIYSAVGSVFVVMYALQPLKMLRNKSAEGLNWREPATSVGVTLAWIVYSFFIGSVPIFAFSLIYLFLYSTTLFLYRRYRVPAPRSS